jgi:hypothetical protein
MAKYSDIKGFTVQTVTSDPAASVAATGSWASGGSLNLARYDVTGAGSQTAALATGGYEPVGNTELYNGSTWTEVNDLNTARYGQSSTGSQTSALAVGGNPNSGITEKWDGTNWTESGDLNTGRHNSASAGSDNEAVITFGGQSPQRNNAEVFNGTSWTEVSELNLARHVLYGTGSSTAALGAGGNLPPSPYTANTEIWNGSSWTETTPSALFKKTVEGQLFFNSTTNTFKETLTDIPGGTWSSGGTMNNDERYFSGGAGIKTAAIAFGGDSPQINKTESYNGTSWTEVNNLNTTKNYVSGAGTYTAALCINGYQNPPNVDLNQVESWDGTNWTEITETNETANAGNVSCGTQTAALITMRSPSPIAGRTELWNGSAWTETTDLNTARPNGAVFGISTSSLASGGSPGATYTQAESWDGSAWTEVGDLNLGRQSLGSAGANNLSGIVFAGNRPGASSPAPGYTEAQRTEFWNGTSWTEINDMSTDRAGGSSSKSGGSATSAHAAGGNAPPYTGVTEEWTVDLANKTITAS